MAGLRAPDYQSGMRRTRPTLRLSAAAAGLALAVAAPADELTKAADTNADGLISAAEHESAAREMFLRMDADHDGQLTAAELESLHARFGPVEDAGPVVAIAERIQSVDVNGDGLVSPGEYEAGAREAYARLDLDRDGRVSAEELRPAQAAPAMPPALPENPG
jgi:hypothetical protein